ncbi:MAG: DUF3137 domain-containing protein [Caulobacterales bacterium]|uniref:DUF3137 domain-containing protein n=1 Tax=Glycocaulis sp. TaxID=1969725 RepID=UPI003FA05D93
MRDFEAIWGEMEPWLASLEDRRTKAVSRLLKGSAVTAAIVAVIVIGGFAMALPAPIIFISSVVTIMGGLAIASGPFYKLRTEVKLGLNERMAEAFAMSYMASGFTPGRFADFRKHNLVPSSNRESFEDYFAGEAHGAKYELYEADLKQRRRNKNKTYYVTVFRGVLIRIEFPRTIEGVTLISRDQGIFNALAGLGLSSNGRKLERVRLVDPKFERIFQIYGSDQVMARYLLTPSFMERVLELETALKGKNVRGVFDEDLAEGFGKGELLLAAETGNLFEPGSLFKPLNVRERVETLYRDFQLIEQIIALVLAPAQLPESVTAPDA